MVPNLLIDADGIDPGRPGSSTSSSSSGLITSQTVCQSTPSRRATDATEALSR
jgi:hypothetical protein